MAPKIEILTQPLPLASNADPSAEAPLLRLAPDSVRRFFERSRFGGDLAFLLQIGLMLVFVRLLNEGVFEAAELTESDFFHSLLIPRLFTHPASIVVALLIGLPMFAGWRRIEWKAIPGGNALRIAVGFMVLSFAWAFSAYHFNYYFNQAHAVDRMLLVVLAALTLWHPAFLPYFLLLTATIARQFEFPFYNYSWTDKIAPFQVLFAFTAFCYVRALFGRANPAAFLVLAISIMGSSYFYSGVEKLRIGWTTRENIGYLFIAAYDNGWWRFLSEEAAVRMYRFISGINGWMIVFTLVVEAGAIVALLHRRIAILFCLGWAGLHLGIFAFTGIFFWKWIIADLVLILLLIRIPYESSPTRWGPWFSFAVSVVLMLGSLHLWQTKQLGWFDTRLSGVFRFYGEGESGAIYEIPPRDMAPYDFMLAQGRLQFLFDRSTLTSTYGETKSRKDAERVNGAKSAEEVINYDNLHKLSTPDERDLRDREGFHRFILGYFSHLNESKGRSRWWRWIEPPQHIWTGETEGSPFVWREALRRVSVRYKQTLLDGNVRTLISDEPVLDARLRQEASTGEAESRD